MNEVQGERIIGKVRRVNGPVVEAEGITDAGMLEMVEVGEVRIIGEISKLSGGRAIIQVYEDTTGIRPGENIYGSGMPLSVELGPGLLGTIYDGIQRPLEEIFRISREYISRGISIPSLNREKLWKFVPAVKEGETLAPGGIIGTVQETEQVEHRIPAPPDCGGTDNLCRRCRRVHG